MLNSNHRLLLALSTAILAIGCTSARAEDPSRQSAMLMNMATCANNYDVVGQISNGQETESIDRVVFTDSQPFECLLASGTQSVNFNFNTSATDSATGCTYTIVRKDKATGATLAATETLECGDLERHYEVIATPLSSDSDCNGLSVIDVDPLVRLSSVPPAGYSVCP